MTNPEIGRSIRTGAFDTNLHEVGTGVPVLMIHGSGPGVSAWANWRGVMPDLARRRRVLAPDMLGFGYTDRPIRAEYSVSRWVGQLLDLMDALALNQADVVGNSFGGAIALALAIRAPKRVRRLVLMGSAGVRFPITPGLEAVWGYQPSLQNMRSLMDVFTHDRSLVNDDLARMRFEASIRPGVQESFAAMFPPPRQRGVVALASREEDIRALAHPTLVLHGREDRVIPLSNSITLAQWIPNSQLHVFGQCGHWTQIEHKDRFVGLVENFLAEADREAAA
jgi:2-hydroxymuconate-semialdehyde hydrolase